VLLETAFGGSRLIDMLAGDYPKPSLTSMSLDGLDNDGAAGEGDYFRGDIEHLQGGQANDILTGNDQANGFAGEDGDDQITGPGGDDVLAGGPGRDMITGGAGRDSLYLADGERDIGDCGADSGSASVDPNGLDPASAAGGPPTVLDGPLSPALSDSVSAQRRVRSPRGRSRRSAAHGWTWS
jgi:hypothetical protein